MASCGTITVVPGFDESDVSVSCDVYRSEVEEGDPVEVDIQVLNDNDTDATATVDLLVDGRRVEDLSVSVGGSGQVSEGFSITDLDVGDHSIDVELSNVRED